MTSSHGRRIQGRRALAILAWITLVAVAGLLWAGQQAHIIRVQAWEPAAILLSAYSTFLAIFGWLLFSPGRASAEESPGLFFAGMLTLLPPCFIAYNLMPAGSPLKPWLTIGIFVFGVLAIMSPLPPEVFAVPRDRRTYLQPLTDAYLSQLDVEHPDVMFDNIAPRTAFRLSRPPSESDPTDTNALRDPWADPFYGTGRQLSRIGVSQSRRVDGTEQTERRRLTDDELTSEQLRASRSEANSEVAPSFSKLAPLRAPSGPRPEPVRPEAVRPDSSQNSASPFLDREPRPVQGVNASVVRPALPHVPPPLPSSARSAEARSADPVVYSGSTQSPRPTQIADASALNSSRRPLTEPGTRASGPVGFQTPTPAVRTLPSSGAPAAPANGPGATMAGAAGIAQSGLPFVPLPVVTSPVTTPTSSSLFSIPSRTESPTSGVRSGDPVPSRTEMSLRDLDRQIREQEAAEAEESAMSEPSAQSVRAPDGEEEISRSRQQSLGGVTLERVKDEHGGEMIEGTIKVFFEVGQKRAHLHVPFSPPLAGLPEVECEPADNDAVRLKVAVRQPYGVRIEARRAEASEALATEISFAAVYTPGPGRG